MEKVRVGLVGLGVMGANLARNLAARGFSTLVYNRTAARTAEFIAEFGHERLRGASDLAELINGLEKPRHLILLIQAGAAVDDFLQQALPWLEKGDTVIDCGNSHYRDSQRRQKELAALGFGFVDCGVSGGEEGALNGPSLMLGGEEKSWRNLQPLWEAIAARDFAEKPTAAWMGGAGGGHYVKMVHNGIEYAIMAVMAEIYDCLRKLCGLDAGAIAAIFAALNTGPLSSYLFEIAAKVLRQKDDLGEGFLVDAILDKAAQKGTGQWVVSDALARGVAVPAITAAVESRISSSSVGLRRSLNSLTPTISPPRPKIKIARATLARAVNAAILSCYAQGFQLLSQAAAGEDWNLNLSEAARVWQGGCIIRSRALEEIGVALAEDNSHLFASPVLRPQLESDLPALRSVITAAVKGGVAVPALSAALFYHDTLTDQKNPANFIQGLRDYFGAHGYERQDRPGQFHSSFNESNA